MIYHSVQTLVNFSGQSPIVPPSVGNIFDSDLSILRQLNGDFEFFIMN